MIAGGSNGSGALNTIDIYDGTTDLVTPAGTMLVARKNFAVSALLDGRVLISGGYGAERQVSGLFRNLRSCGPNLGRRPATDRVARQP